MAHQTVKSFGQKIPPTRALADEAIFLRLCCHRPGLVDRSLYARERTGYSDRADRCFDLGVQIELTDSLGLDRAAEIHIPSPW
jgi:hypothetical protein